MFSRKHPEFRRPTVGPRRSTWLSHFAELFFGMLAKATMVIAALVVLALVLLSGGAALSELPTTRRGWRNLLLVLLVILMAVAIGMHVVRI